MGKRHKKIAPEKIVQAPVAVDPIIVHEPVVAAPVATLATLNPTTFSLSVQSLDFTSPNPVPALGLDGLQHVGIKAGGALYMDRDWASFLVNFGVSDADGLINAGQIALRMTSGDGEVWQLDMQQAPIGWLAPNGQEIAIQALPPPPDPANFIWVANNGPVTQDTDGYDPNATAAYVNIGEGGQYLFGADYRDAGEHYLIQLLADNAVQATIVVDLV